MKPWLPLVGVLLLLLPIAPVALAVQYGLQAHEQPEYTFLTNEENEDFSRDVRERRYSFEVERDWAYLVIVAFFGGCCPRFEDSDAIQATITAPNGRGYIIAVKAGEECHWDDPRNCDEHEVNPGGTDWIILVDPPIGGYEVVLRPAGNLKEFDSWHQEGIAAVAYPSQENHGFLRGNNVWWYYPDGTSKFVEDGGYFSWDDAKPRIAALGVLSVAGWITGIVILVKARRLRKE